MDVHQEAYGMLERFALWTPPGPRGRDGLPDRVELAFEVGARRYLTASLRGDEKLLSRLELAGLPGSYPQDALTAIYPWLGSRLVARESRTHEIALYAVLRGARLVREVGAVAEADDDTVGRILLDRGIVLPHKSLDENLSLVRSLERAGLDEESIAGAMGYAPRTIRTYLRLSA